ncbi:MAG: YdcF family protein [Candidatus Electrothrix sp. MAN1_4]|nr:YdcF family protein [Candidatus Electrothrix sp. MAN1_4]
MKARLPAFFFGMLCGAMLIMVSGGVFMRYAPFLLVVDEPVTQADIAVVLGGGGGSRLSKGLSLYESGFVNHLVLVDRAKRDWAAMLQRLCPDCATTGKITILEGSQNTFTDAEITERYCCERNIKSMLIVTDPYHTRRASLIFNRQFATSEVQISVVSSGAFGSRLRPDEHWWEDDNTLRTVWTEMNKILIILLRDYEILADSTHR